MCEINAKSPCFAISITVFAQKKISFARKKRFFAFYLHICKKSSTFAAKLD